VAEVLQVKGLRVYYHTPQGPVKAVDGVSFSLLEGERFSLVGESGSGKSTAALAILRLIKPPGRVEAGEVFLDGQDLMRLSEEEMRRVRLARVSLIPQGAMNSLNPVMCIKDQILDGLRDHGAGKSRHELEEQTLDLLQRVGLRREVASMFPHELSGGMRQRVCIAIAICLGPKVIIGDEPTSALDVVVQRQVIETLRKVQEELGSSVILVGHDMGLMAQFVDRLGVMYAGKLVETGPVREVFKSSLHPYTQLLIASLPSLAGKGAFRGIPGLPPSLLFRPAGCPFHPRCPRVMSRCSEEDPPLRQVQASQWVACHLYSGEV
jgi:peptide/nickel transport system ATP-binding protein